MRIIIINILLIFSIECIGQFTFQNSASDTDSYSFVNLNTVSAYEFQDSSIYTFTSSDSFSVSVWFKTEKSNFSDITIAQKLGEWSINVKDANTSSPYLECVLGAENNTYTVKANINSAAVSSEIWHGFFYHAVMTYDGSGVLGGLKLYINGFEPTNINTSGISLSMGIGSSIKIGNNNFSYSQFSIYDKLLSSNDVKTLYNLGEPIILLDPVFFHSARENLQEYYQGETLNVFNGNFFPKNLRYQKYRLGDELSISIDAEGRYGQRANFAIPNLMTSPVYGEWYSPFVWYDSTYNKTYLTVQLRGGIGFDRGAEYYVFDHKKRELTNLPIRLESINKENSDVHNLTTIIKTKDNYFLSGREDGHTSPIYVAKTNDFNSFSEASVINTSTGAYVNFFYLNDSLRAIMRITANKQNDGQVIAFSGNHGDSWSNVTDLAQSESSFFWGYPGVYYYDESKVFSFYFARAGNGGNWQGIYCMASKDGRVWKSVDGSFSKNIYNNGHWVESELFSHGLVDSIPRSQVNPANTIDCIDVVIDSTNTPHLVYVNTLVDSTYYAKFQNGDWVKRAIDIPTWIGDYRATAALIWKGGDDFDLIKIETRNSFDCIVKYSTQNGFETVTDEGILSKKDKNYSQIVRTHNAKIGQPFVIAASEVQADGLEGSNLWVYEYRF